MAAGIPPAAPIANEEKLQTKGKPPQLVAFPSLNYFKIPLRPFLSKSSCFI